MNFLPNQSKQKIASRRRGWSKRGIRTFSAAAAVVLALLIVTGALAFTVNNVDGTWGNIDGVTAGPGTQDVIGGATTSGSSATLYPTRADQLRVRNAAICRGDPDGDTTFTDWSYNATPAWGGLGSHTSTCSPIAGLIISEYVYDRASGTGGCSSTSTTDTDCDLLGFEIYNGTGTSVNLANFSVRIYSGGRNDYTTYALSGTLANNDVYVIVNYRASVPVTGEDLTISNDNDDGDDNAYRSIALYNENETAGARCNRWASGNGNTPTAISSGDLTVQNVSTTDENQVRYGRRAYNPSEWQSLSCDLTPFANQSGFGFDGNNGPVTPASDTPFYLGKFTHYNNQVFSTDDSYNNANALSNVSLTVGMPLTCNDGSTPTPATLSFASNFVLDETSNTAGTCIYPGTSTCPDKITVTQPSSSTFTCPEGDYTVNILGFQPQNAGDPDCSDAFTGNTQTEFITEEDTDNVACLWAEITAPTADITPDKTCADFNTLNPSYTIVTTNLGPGSARGAQISDTLPTGVVYKSYTSQLITNSGTVNAGTCTYNTGTRLFSCQLLTSLPPNSLNNARWQVVIQVQNLDNSGTITFPLSNTVTASMSTTDVNSGNNSDTCTSTEPTSATVSQPIASTLDQTIVVAWETFDETNIIGFDLYRATPDGERSLVDSRTADKGPGSVYEYIDANVQPGVLYTYWLEVRTKYGIVKMEPTSALLLVNPLKIYLPTIHR